MRNVNTICNYPNDQEMIDSEFWERGTDKNFEDENGEDEFDEDEYLEYCLEMHFDKKYKYEK